MIVDCHVHVLAATPGHGRMSGRLRRRPNVVLVRLRLGIPLFGSDDQITGTGSGTRPTGGRLSRGGL